MRLGAGRAASGPGAEQVLPPRWRNHAGPAWEEGGPAPGPHSASALLDKWLTLSEPSEDSIALADREGFYVQGK